MTSGQLLLPDELFRAAGKSFRINVGEPIPWQSLRTALSVPEEEAARIRSICYALRDEYERRKKQHMYTTPIIPPVPKELILGELTPDKRLRLTNKGATRSMSSMPPRHRIRCVRSGAS